MSDGIPTESRVLKYPEELFEPEPWLNFVQGRPFERAWKKLELSDDDLRHIEIVIMADPERPPVISGTGGIRKLRVAKPGTNEGSSGGLRILYSHYSEFSLIYLYTAYAKNNMDNISARVKQELYKLNEEIKNYLQCRQLKN